MWHWGGVGRRLLSHTAREKSSGMCVIFFFFFMSMNHAYCPSVAEGAHMF